LHEAECVEIRLQRQDRAAPQIAFPQAPDVECHEDSIMSVTDRFSSAVIAGALYGSRFRASGTPKLYRSPACEIAVDSILQLRATLA